ncbi:TonB-dependent receptor [Sphingosinicella sp. BN140058]|uniref:TonB-dependent receptor n=1 Tax=Sphingosinicella sp. BN140058 TaxID=1892855 RepID=UPI0013EB1698|nr:TonB-dependent receptor [Sphingosinicella sp. BN140058]
MQRSLGPLLGGLSLLALCASPASAQTGSDADDATAAPDAIFVTARKQAETLQDVPMAVTAISDTELERRGVQDVNDLTAEVPGLFVAPGSVNNSADFAYLTMRGVGFNAGLEPAVGVFVDGMYLPQMGFDTSFLDIARVEVLRGPQGTLFGRNTQGGAVNLVTRMPGPDLRGRLRLEAAEFDSYWLQGVISGQIGTGLYAGIGAEHRRSNGFLHNIVSGDRQGWYRQSALRGTLRWTPSDTIDVALIGDWSDRDYNEAIRGVRLATRRYESVVDQDSPDRKDNRGAQLNVTAQLGGGMTLTSISGARYTSSDVFTDMDSRITAQNPVTLPAAPPLAATPQSFRGATLDVEIQQRFVSQELRLNGRAGPIDWLAGTYLFDQRQDQRRDRRVGRGVAPFPAALYIYEDYRDDRDGIAGFANAIYHVTDRLEVTAGGRWSHEKVEGTGQRVQVFGPPVNSVQPVVRDARDDFDNVSWTGSISYRPAADILLYATYAEGWKAGGINRFPGNAASNLPYKDESSKNYEIGAKTRLFDRRATFNAALYHIDIRNQQLINVIPTGGPTPVSVVESAARAHVDGAEIEVVAHPSDQLQLRGSASYSRSRFDDFVRVFTASDRTDFSGTPFENVPETTLFAAADYALPLGRDRRIALHAEYRYVDAITYQDNTRASRSGDQLTAPAYDRVDVSVSYEGPGGLRLTAFVDNLFDTFDYSFPSSDPLLGGDLFVVPLPPRQFGLRAAIDL